MTQPSHSPYTGYTPGDKAPRIVTCRRCDGRGYFDRTDEILHPHSGEVLSGRPHRVPCACCKGSGRMILTMSFEPYTPGKSA